MLLLDAVVLAGEVEFKLGFTGTRGVVIEVDLELFIVFWISLFWSLKEVLNGGGLILPVSPIVKGRERTLA